MRVNSPGGDHHGLGSRPHNYGPPPVSSSHTVPPSPPIDPQLGFDLPHQSRSPTSSPSASSAPQYPPAGSTNSLESHSKCVAPPTTTSHPSQSIPPHLSQPTYPPTTYPPSPSAASNYSYPSPAPPNNFGGGPGTYSALHSQRPLPTNFPPPVPNGTSPQVSAAQDASALDLANTTQFQQQHQHHHYIATTSSSTFASHSQDRYVCQVCNKAFSRPSSLRIHSHSHTGEKPFQCPHKGCGKAFSVRSNMKRHERGCHGGGSPGST